MSSSQDMKNPSRRGLLAGIPGTALVAMAAVPVAIAGADAELFALASLIESASKKYNEALNIFADAETAYFKNKPQKPVFDNELYRHLKGDEKRVYFDAWGPLIDDYETRDAEIKEQYRVEELREAYEPLEDAHDELLSQLAGMRAQTISGLRLKAELSEHSDELMQSVIDDLLAMEVKAS